MQEELPLDNLNSIKKEEPALNMNSGSLIGLMSADRNDRYAQSTKETTKHCI
jgi:hypothetical protein